MLKRKSKPGPIGLDIGTSGVKLLQLANEGGQPSVVASAYCPFPSDSPDGVDPAHLIERTIADALRHNPFKGRAVVTAFGSGDFLMKNIRLPRMPADELSAAVQFEAAERFDLGGKAAQIRFLPVGEVRHGNELKEEVIVFSALDEAVNDRLQLLDTLKLTPVALDITPCAVARSFVRFLRRAEDAEAINIFLEVGYGASAIIVTRGPEVSFLKLIDIGGRHFNKAVAKTLGISEREAANLRIRIMRDRNTQRAGDGDGIQDDIAAAVTDAVRPSIERLSRDVQLCMRYFAVTFRGQRPDSLTLVGGEAHEPSMTTILSEGINTPCTIGHPLRGIAHLGDIAGRDRRTTQPAWAVAGGLALWGSPWVTHRMKSNRNSSGKRMPRARTETRLAEGERA
ncbi:MAG: pilus assembly protein PilM [Phycisphaerae bacterium]